MHIDARTLPNHSTLHAHICIIGAGPAGISIALEWLNSNHTVIILEGGGYHVDNRMQALYKGKSIGQKYYPLEAARLHYFGGTSGHWGGLCSTLDPIDFRKRDWVPESGWPITWDDLSPYFERAQDKLEVPSKVFDLKEWMKQDAELRPMPLDSEIIQHKPFQFSPPTRFGTRYRSEIERSKNVTLYTNANVTSIDANESSHQITSVSTRDFEGHEHEVTAEYYVLACGGIENARLLLCSNKRSAKGLGNDEGNVGRYFMEHVESVSADLIMPRPGPMKLYLLDFYKTKVRAELMVNEAVQEKTEILNGTVSLMAKEGDKPSKSNIEWFDDNAENTVKMWEEMDRVNSDSDQFSLHNITQKIKQKWAPLGGLVKSNRSQTFELFTRMEQSPNPNSRVYLSNEKDELGMNRITLDWQLTALEKKSIRKLHELVGQEIGRAGLGRVRLMEWLRDENDQTWPSILGGGWHHMGTTRMHSDPKKGVVDKNCKVHGIGNLFIAGSSCFTTAGAASPTLNLIALSLRLSDFLKQQVKVEAL